MYIDRERRFLPDEEVCIYYEWYDRTQRAGLYITQHNSSDNVEIEDATYLGYSTVAEVTEFAKGVDDTALWETVQFMWEIFQANQSE